MPVTYGGKTSEEIQAEIEAKLARIEDPAERAAMLAAEEANDRLECIRLSRMLQADIQPIPGDLHHIKVNGEVMGYAEYHNWASRRYAELYPEEIESPDDEDTEEEDRDEDDDLNLGFFN